MTGNDQAVKVYEDEPALSRLEAEVKESPQGRNFLPILVGAYIGAGRDSDAANALTRYGHSQADVNRELDQIRDELRRRQR